MPIAAGGGPIFDVVFGTVFPVLANCASVLLFLSSVPNILLLRKSRQLGDVDGNVYCMLLMSCIGWTAYGLQLKSITIAPLNAFGCVVMLWCSLSYYTIIPQYTAQKYRYEKLFFACALTPFIIALIWYYTVSDYDTATLVAGSLANAGYVIFLSSPLSLIRQIVRTKSVAVLSAPLTIINFVNCCMWTMWALIYNGDYFVYVPNGVGVLINAIFLTLIMCYRNSAATMLEHTESESSSVATSSNGSPVKPNGTVQMSTTPSKGSRIPYSTMIDVDDRLERQDSTLSDIRHEDSENEPSMTRTFANGVTYSLDTLQQRVTPKSAVRQLAIT